MNHAYQLQIPRSVRWGLFIIISALCAYVSFRIFPFAFSFISVNITMTRKEALAKAAALAQEHNWQPTTDFQSAVSFDSDKEVQIFAERAAGGVAAFNKMIDNKLYAPHQWHVRHFVPKDERETHIFFTSEGSLYGFQSIIPETELLPSLAPEQALSLAQSTLDAWKIDREQYTLLGQSSHITPVGRTDQFFVYERTNATLGAATYRLMVEISGNRVTQLMHTVKVPESFLLEYQEMRSANESIASAASYVMYLLYLLLCCGIGLFVLIRSGYLQVKTALVCAAIVALLEALSSISELPLAWMQYHTALNPYIFLTHQISSIATSFIYHTAFYAFVFAIAESLTRKAFGSHIQLWRSWSKAVASSKQILGRTIAGYLLFPIDMAIGLATYMLCKQYLGWWVPAGHLSDPNILAEYAPWLSAFSRALSAGFFEECLFRAVPIASAALIGGWLNKRRLFIVIGFIIQILVFGAAHANYAAQPAYARVIELIIPSAIFGYLYLRYGLLLPIIMHVVYDIFWFALPLFISQGSNVWMQKAAVIMLACIPLIVVIFRRLQYGAWHNAFNSAYNASWHPQETTSIARDDVQQQVVRLPYFKYSIAALLLGIGGIGYWLHTQNKLIPAITISKSDAINKAETLFNTLEQNRDAWTMRVTSSQTPSGLEEQYVWQQSHALYAKLMGSFIPTSGWIIRYNKCSNITCDRSEIYNISISGSGSVTRIQHSVPEHISAQQITLETARTLARETFNTIHNDDLNNLTEISAEAVPLASRQDWRLRYADSRIPEFTKNEAQAAITVTGNAVIDIEKQIVPPQEWVRHAHHQSTLLSLFNTFLFLLVCIIAAALTYALLPCLQWSRISLRMVIGIVTILTLWELLTNLNYWPDISGSFNPITPLSHQLFTTIGSYIINALFNAITKTAYILLAYLCITAERSDKSYHSWFIGVALGIGVAGIIACMSLFKPMVTPQLPMTNFLGSYLPITTVSPWISGWLTITTALSLVMVALEAMRRRYQLSSSIYTVSAVTIITVLQLFYALDHVTLIPYTLITSAILAVIFVFLYRLLFRHDYALIGPFVAGILTRNMAFNLWYHLSFMAIIDVSLAFIAMMIVSFVWFRYMNNKITG